MINIEKYLEHIETKSLNKGTISAYKTDLTQFQKFSKVATKYATTEDILSFIDSLKEKDISPATINRKISSIKSYYKYLIEQEEVLFSPAEIVEYIPHKREIPRPVTVSEFKKLMEVVDNTRDKALMEVMFHAGLRRVEVVNLRMEDIDLATRRIKVKGTTRKKDRYVPIVPENLTNLLLWVRLNSHKKWVFFSNYSTTNPYHIRWVNSTIERAVDLAGLSKEITPSSFRYSYGAYLKRNKASYYTIALLVGFGSPSTARVFKQVEEELAELEYLEKKLQVLKA